MDRTGSKFDALLSRAVAAGDVPFVVAMVATPDAVLYQGAVGAPVDALFRIASMTKPLTSVAILMLAERGLLELDDLAGRYLPQYAGREVLESVDMRTGEFTTRPAATPLTLRTLLTHTAGFCYGFGSAAVTALTRGGRRSETALPLLHDPGARWTYGPNTLVLGEVISAITGAPFYEFFDREIMRPLGMRDTGYFLRAADAGRLLPSYKRAPGRLVRNPDGPHMPYLGADGGLLGTAADYIRFMQMLLQGGVLEGARVLSPASVELLFTDQLAGGTVQLQRSAQPDIAADFPSGAGVDTFSLAFQLKGAREPGVRAPGSASWGGVHNTHFWIDREQQIAALLMTQLLPFCELRCMALLDAFERAVYAD